MIWFFTPSVSLYQRYRCIQTLYVKHTKRQNYVMIFVSFCRVWNCISDLIVNVALEALYIHEEGGNNGVIDSWNGNSDLQVILICDQYIGWRWRRLGAFRVTISCLDTVSVVGYKMAGLFGLTARHTEQVACLARNPTPNPFLYKRN